MMAMNEQFEEQLDHNEKKALIEQNGKSEFAMVDPNGVYDLEGSGYKYLYLNINQNYVYRRGKKYTAAHQDGVIQLYSKDANGDMHFDQAVEALRVELVLPGEEQELVDPDGTDLLAADEVSDITHEPARAPFSDLCDREGC